MYLSKFQLFNYKSLLDSGLLDFTLGINIIFGQNYSGKTALLEALSLNFADKPHRSIKTFPDASSRIDEESKAEISLTFHKDEFRALINQLPPYAVGIFQLEDNTITPEQLVSLFQEWLDNPDPAEIIISTSGGDNFTEWLVEKEPDRLSELAEFLQNVLDRREEKLRGCL